MSPLERPYTPLDAAFFVKGLIEVAEWEELPRCSNCETLFKPDRDGAKYCVPCARAFRVGHSIGWQEAKGERRPRYFVPAEMVSLITELNPILVELAGWEVQPRGTMRYVKRFLRFIASRDFGEILERGAWK